MDSDNHVFTSHFFRGSSNFGPAMLNFPKLLSLLTAITICISPGLRKAEANEMGWPRTIVHAAGKFTLANRPLRIISTTPSVTGILLSMNAPVIATAATTPSGLTDQKGFFSQWAQVADERGVQVLYPNLNFDMEAVIGWDPDLVIASATGADSILSHVAELQAQGIPTLVVNYSNRSWQALAIEIGRATGLEHQAEEAIRRFDTKVAQVAATLAAPREPVSIVGYNISGSFSIGRPESPQAKLLQSLGLTVAGLPETLKSQVSRSSDFDFISRENLPLAIEGSHVFLLRGTSREVDAFLADPLLGNATSVKMHQVYPLGPTSFRIDYYSGLQMIHLVADALRAR
ncbi:Fe2+-enterobactin ABC transporter substrate-binding protein [Rhizobium sp. SL86]|uniref:Fe2+-enterobactin ABC transporter substrate-binding protein n=1 Tax=Rhizobium sp. SL86 TaxID=2995148 RepID=UPI002272B647|nr:Fe2+-enterobactin ABC transporter substrate-binding protein [Rhizobium sp. SL86]MCY1667678.1 Fe2+-enterobactin ABC transporter substrate-binding protein [Rhizobium sp. SL86]